MIFTVLNAGPATIHLERGLPIFLLWIADLDGASVKRKYGVGPEGITADDKSDWSFGDGVASYIYGSNTAADGDR